MTRQSPFKVRSCCSRGPRLSAGARPKDMRSSFTRRRFLTVLAGVALGGMTLWGLRPWTRGILARLSGRYDSLTHPALARAATGALSPRALQVLQAAVSTLVDTDVEMSHYVEYFTWRAESLPGYSQLYEEFARRLDLAAARRGGGGFAEGHAESRRRLLQQINLKRGSLRMVAVALIDPDWLRFEQYIVREVLALFVRTDGWVLLGYETWPGTPRGLDLYTRPPATRRHAA